MRTIICRKQYLFEQIADASSSRTFSSLASIGKGIYYSFAQEKTELLIVGFSHRGYKTFLLSRSNNNMSSTLELHLGYANFKKQIKRSEYMVPKNMVGLKSKSPKKNLTMRFENRDDFF